MGLFQRKKKRFHVHHYIISQNKNERAKVLHEMVYYCKTEQEASALLLSLYQTDLGQITYEVEKNKDLYHYIKTEFYYGRSSTIEYDNYKLFCDVRVDVNNGFFIKTAKNIETYAAGRELIRRI